MHLCDFHIVMSLHAVKEKPVALLPVMKPIISFPVKTVAELKEKTITMTKAETMSAQPTTGMSSHSITVWS